MKDPTEVVGVNWLKFKSITRINCFFFLKEIRYQRSWQGCNIAGTEYILQQSFKTSAPLHSGLSGDFLLIYTSFWFPVDGEFARSQSLHPLPGYLLAAQRSICLFHGCEQCFLTSVLRLAIVSWFTKGVPFVEKSGRRNAPLFFVPGKRVLHSLSLA